MLHRFIVVSSVWQIHFFQTVFCIIYIMETFPLEFFDLISNFDFLLFCPNWCPININPVLFFPLNLTFWFYICLKIPWITFIFNLSDDIVVFNSFKNCSLSLIFKVTLRSGTIVVSPFKTFMNFSGIAFFILENS
jgi:hypothetical protein